jgi:hypothetical protein
VAAEIELRQPLLSSSDTPLLLLGLRRCVSFGDGV